MYINRYLENQIRLINSTFKVLYLGGPRQVGKTTMLKTLANDYGMNYVTLDDLNYRNLAKTEPQIFLQQFSKKLIIDEVQYAPELFPYIKIEADNSAENGIYWLTGSQHFNIIKNLQETLAGRVAILALNTLSIGESRQLSANKDPFLPVFNPNSSEYNEAKNNIFEYIIKGGFPALYLNSNIPREIFYSSYVQTYIERDLVNLFGIQNTSRFYRFLQLCADRTGQVLNYSDLARDADIAVSTAKDWIEILEGTMQIYLLQPFSNNFSKRLIKSPKMYFMDTGLASYLTGWSTVDGLVRSVYAGKIYETFVVSEIIKSYLYRGINPKLYFYRDKQAREVDLLIEYDNQLYPVEIKSGSTFKTDYINTIEYLKASLPNIESSAVIMNINKAFLASSNIAVMPELAIN